MKKASTQKWRVTFTKVSNKKRKLCSDGYINASTTTTGAISCTLFDAASNFLAKSANLQQELATDTSLQIGCYEVDINEPISDFMEQSDAGSSVTISESTVAHRISPFAKFSSVSPLEAPFQSVPGNEMEKLDSFLERVMKPHQLTAAKFVLKRLRGQENDESFLAALHRKMESHGISDSTTSDDDEEKFSKYCGAILADEMGLGKTLTAIAVLWTLVKTNRRRGIVVCPASLIENWLKELKKWLSIRLSPLHFSDLSSPQDVLQQFRSPRITNKSSVLVISYEMFRKYNDQLRVVPGLEILVCDEGHRLKNVDGSKTIDALTGCCAKCRLLLTGTPIQNDLDELYSLVNFVAPGFLGTLSQYQRFVSHRIGTSSREEANPYSQEVSAFLQARLSQLMIRRTQNELLQDALPCRTDYVINCELTEPQRADYCFIAESLLRSMGASNVSMLNAASYSGSQREETEVLPALQTLRKICNYALPTAGANGETACAEMRTETNDILFRSVKLQVVDEMLSTMFRLDSSSKIVIISNFTSTLDELERVLDHRGWSFLRLDGGVSVANRQSLVDRFNCCLDKRRIFLLSSKAGGLGLNLIGGSRLVMLDCDWNPANDIQAMSRIWRQGQTRPVSIYRLVAAKTIEAAILRRQQDKLQLSKHVKSACSEERASLSSSSSSSSSSFSSSSFSSSSSSSFSSSSFDVETVIDGSDLPLPLKTLSTTELTSLVYPAGSSSLLESQIPGSSGKEVGEGPARNKENVRTRRRWQIVGNSECTDPLLLAMSSNSTS